MGLEEELKMIEAKIRSIYINEIQPLEDIRQKIQGKINEQKVEVIVDDVEVENIKSKYKGEEKLEKLVK